MKKHKKAIFILLGAGALIGIGVALYIFLMPHRDVRSAKTDFSLGVGTLVNEYLIDLNAANEKYLSEDGDSKIIEISGIVVSVSQDMQGHTVVLITDGKMEVGAQCTLLPEFDAQSQSLAMGSAIKLKGVIQAGAGYDSDLELYEHVVINQCSIL